VHERLQHSHDPLLRVMFGTAPNPIRQGKKFFFVLSTGKIAKQSPPRRAGTKRSRAQRPGFVFGDETLAAISRFPVVDVSPRRPLS
jgi:hypothetical protein